MDSYASSKRENNVSATFKSVLHCFMLLLHRAEICHTSSSIGVLFFLMWSQCWWQKSSHDIKSNFNCTHYMCSFTIICTLRQMWTSYCTLEVRLNIYRPAPVFSFHKPYSILNKRFIHTISQSMKLIWVFISVFTDTTPHVGTQTEVSVNT